MPSWLESSTSPAETPVFSRRRPGSPAPGPGIPGTPNGRTGIGGRQPVAELVLAGRKASHPGLFWWQRRQSRRSPRLGPRLSPFGLRPLAPGLPRIRRQPGNSHRDGSLPGRSGGLGLARQRGRIRHWRTLENRWGPASRWRWRLESRRPGSSFNRVFLRRWMWVNPGIPFCLWVF